jgi:hypothetical protein
MGYVIALIIVLLLVAGFITFMVMNASRRGGEPGPTDPGASGSPAGIAAPDSSPLGDSAEHAGLQEGGTTVRDPENEGTDPAQGRRPRVGDPGPETVDRP